MDSSGPSSLESKARNSYLLTKRNIPIFEAVNFLAATVERNRPKGQRSASGSGSPSTIR